MLVVGDAVIEWKETLGCVDSFESIVLTVGLSLKVTFLGAFFDVFVGLRGCPSRRGVCSEVLALVKAMGEVKGIKFIFIDKNIEENVFKIEKIICA